MRPKPVAISSKISNTSWRRQIVAQVIQVSRIVEAHPARALHHRLDDHGGQLGGVLRQLRLERRAVGRVVVAGHLRGEHLVGQDDIPDHS